jgi:hypothetical protein
MALFRRTKGLAKKVLGVDESMGKVSWRFHEADVWGCIEVIRTATDETLLVGHTTGPLTLTLSDCELDAADTIARLIGETVRLGIQMKQAEESAERRRENGVAADSPF